MRRGEEETAWDGADYKCFGKREENKDTEVDWRPAMMVDKRGLLHKSGPVDESRPFRASLPPDPAGTKNVRSHAK